MHPSDPLDYALLTAFLVANYVIAWCYVWVLGRRAWELNRSLWGSFVTVCGFGHALMATYMVFFPGLVWLWVAVVVADVVTALVSLETVYSQPDPP